MSETDHSRNRMSETSQRLLSAKEAAARLGCSRSTLGRIIRRGEIGYFKLSPSRLMFSEKHLSEFLLGREYTPTPVSEVKAGKSRQRKAA